MNKTAFPARTGALYLSFMAFIVISLNVHGQNSYNYFCRVYFRDKGENQVLNFSMSDLLSDRAVKRRTRVGVSGLDYNDIPVSLEYINTIKSLGFSLHCTSKWQNTALFKTKSFPDTASLRTLHFISKVKIVKKPAGKSARIEKLSSESTETVLPPYDRPLTLMNGDVMHTSGYDGTGVLIAVLDAGFLNGKSIPSLTKLFLRDGIKSTRDFVGNSSYVYDYHSHGTAVLSVLAGLAENNLEGTAPGADYILLRTEDVSSEFPVEEDYWAAAAEYADSAGADIISSSLGYFNFDDPSMNYSFKDLDGKTTFITRAADIAASKGILVVCSAGNERDKSWIHIIAPSDGDSVLAAGAVDANNVISSFSSAGPSADGRIKPDNTAMGVAVAAQIAPDGFVRLNGTSLSCPVLSGLAATLLQAVPGASNMEIINALHRAGDRISVPDTLYGYGTPDILKALDYLQDTHLNLPGKGISLWPNPVTGSFEINFSEAPGSLHIEIFSGSGCLLAEKNFSSYAGRKIVINDLSDAAQGIYLVRIRTGMGNFVKKIIKMNDK